MKTVIDPIELFKLKAIKAAKVSEVSEATASSNVPINERVNFHIGNPVQDTLLYSSYLRLALGIDINRDEISEENIEAVIDNTGYELKDKNDIEFLLKLIKSAAPYMARGGFNKNNPGYLVNYFADWLAKNQREPLSYDLGANSGKREIIISTGGIYEAFRLLFSALNNYLIVLPAKVYLFGNSLPNHLLNFNNLEFNFIQNDEQVLIDTINNSVCNFNLPHFLILSVNTSEKTRRQLRNISLDYPIFFIETNNAFNHLSLAREAKMENRVLRLITPEVFNTKFTNSPIVFFAGNSDFIKVIENIQFQLKGTPSSTEVEFLSYILQNKNLENHNNTHINVTPQFEKSILPVFKNSNIHRLSSYYSSKINNVISTKEEILNKYPEKFNKIINLVNNKLKLSSSFFKYDLFSETKAVELLNKLILHFDDYYFTDTLIKSFLFSFLKHHPEYKYNSCIIVSGSSRTALGILGFSCGLEHVVFPDLSWTYEHCFPNSTVVPLTDDFEPDINKIAETVISLTKQNGNDKSKFAVALNNPHNATGMQFNYKILKQLLKVLLQNNIFVIDDLSYQNVAPEKEYSIIKTLRLIADELYSEGYITEENSNKLITIHSLSKTDSYAGARLTVAEIRDKNLFSKFTEINKSITPNYAAIFLAYLFYRNKVEDVNTYWDLRNKIFYNRMKALSDAVLWLPEDRNKYNIYIKAPKGSMYPQMIIEKLPSGISLDWLASGLARQGIGLIPLSTFARTEKGFDSGRKTFRLTLGGTDSPEILHNKTRRVLIDLNRMIAEEEAGYVKKSFPFIPFNLDYSYISEHETKWEFYEHQIVGYCKKFFDKEFAKFHLSNTDLQNDFFNNYLPDRLLIFKQRFIDRAKLIYSVKLQQQSCNYQNIIENLKYEFFRDDINNRLTKFKTRLYDRTVHPTQIYGIKSELYFDKIIELLLRNKTPKKADLQQLTIELINEFTGLNVAIKSKDEPDELLLDLSSAIYAELFINLHGDKSYKTFLSFWGDWDGSNRPSGQGHSLVAAVVIKNVTNMASFLKLLLKADSSIELDSELLNELENLPETNKKFIGLLKQITELTHKLEKRFKGVLPYKLNPGILRKIGMSLHIADDPLIKLWKHNDRLETKMLNLRKQRKDLLEYYFLLNKKLRKNLYRLIPNIERNLNNQDILREAILYKDLLKRFVITPRIHQKMITAQDQFAVDTTVYNIYEINQISASYGNPGMVLGLQISMSNKPESVIALDRKLVAEKEKRRRNDFNNQLPSVLLIPLFEDIDAVKGITGYLNKVWDYALQSRRIDIDTAERFSEIIGEVFIAGSDLSQQIGQTAGMNLFKQSKYNLTIWLAEKGLIGKIRMKMGCGEPMQRQGGFYTEITGEKAFIRSKDTDFRFSLYLKESTKKSTEYAVTPLLGVFAGGDLRTFQSTISEKLRHIPIANYALLLNHVKQSQLFYENELIRAGEPLKETRLQFKTRGLKELERLTIGRKDALFDKFAEIFTNNFKHILYGSDEDVVGIHIISYFIARTSPVLRDRPTVRPEKSSGTDMGQKILEKIAETIPFAKYGSFLRAIAHNLSQTTILGINQLTTGLFRAFDDFARQTFAEGDAFIIIEDRILPKLPVYELLHSLRLFQDNDLTFYGKLENAFKAGNSALISLHEDLDAQKKYIPLFQKELLRRHGLDVTDFFEGGKFIYNLLPTLRPDLAVLLQPDLFNTDINSLKNNIIGYIDANWLKEVDKLLRVRKSVNYWRIKIWDLLEKPVFTRVNSFVELATALYPLTLQKQTNDLPFMPKSYKLPIYDKTNGDENMNKFLSAAFNLLSAISEDRVDVPINIIKALQEAKNILKIEQQALSITEQKLFRFYLLQIARITGENG
ncbi:MAG TPA: aminotransferase class I/II-fold pyridoxal phosphate-dependent enzyme [Melioribacteraceae bacterium]|nr:aminotransferase class I/II-fold pyridoxal phosphate-dependent enzyme [Melioribacteraceae bacterium]